MADGIYTCVLGLTSSSLNESDREKQTRHTGWINITFHSVCHKTDVTLQD